MNVRPGTARTRIQEQTRSNVCTKSKAIYTTAQNIHQVVARHRCKHNSELSALTNRSVASGDTSAEWRDRPVPGGDTSVPQPQRPTPGGGTSLWRPKRSAPGKSAPPRTTLLLTKQSERFPHIAERKRANECSPRPKQKQHYVHEKLAASVNANLTKTTRHLPTDM